MLLVEKMYVLPVPFRAHVSRAIKMMMGIGMPSSQSRIERMSTSELHSSRLPSASGLRKRLHLAGNSKNRAAGG